jgi:homoserine O-acetyltransferase
MTRVQTSDIASPRLRSIPRRPAGSADHSRRVVFETVGPADAPAVVVLGGISASRHVTATESDPRHGWWEALVGPEKVVDTDRFRVVGMDYLSVGRRNRPLTTHDQALALAAALDRAAIPKVRAIIGASYGGMVALAFGAIAPQRVEQLVVIGAAHESAPLSTALRILQRRIVELGIATGTSRDALVIARGLAMTTYASAEEFSDRFGGSEDREVSDKCDEIDAFLTSSGKTFATACTPERFLALSQSLDLHKVKPEDIRVPTTLIAVQEDVLVPLAQIRELAARIGAPCSLVEISSSHGHDTFLSAPALLAPFVSQSLQPRAGICT